MMKFARLALAGLLAISAGGIARADDAQMALERGRLHMGRSRLRRNGAILRAVSSVLAG